MCPKLNANFNQIINLPKTFLKGKKVLVTTQSSYHLMRKYLKISSMVSNREAQDSNITEYLPAVSCVAFNNDLKGAIHLLFLVSEKTFWVC